MNLKQTFIDLIHQELPEVMKEAVENRRYLHMNPEVGFETQNTERFVREKLQAMGVEILDAKIGVMGMIPGADHSRIVALRADMDALPVQEENDVPYCSQIPGKSHACGHDGHTAMLLGAAKILSAHRDVLPVDVLLVFQPAEEGPDLGGARVMLADLREKGMADKIMHFFGLHVFNDYAVGSVGAKYGAMASSTDEFDITILGRGGHAGFPHRTVDALSVGAKVINNMESFMSRRMDPFDQAIFSVGVFQAGSAKNVVADRAKLAGTIRCQKEATRAMILENMERIVKSTCEAFGASCEIDVLHGLPVLVNEKNAVDYSVAVAQALVGHERVQMLPEPMMGAEDFAYFAEAVPSSFLWIGSGNPEKGFTGQNHHPKFDFDEDAMATGIPLLCGLAAGIE